MKNNFALISRKAGEWSMQPELSAKHRQAARTLDLMARRYANDPMPNPIADKSVRMLGCHLCRLVGDAGCKGAPPQGACPLGFIAAPAP